MGKGSEKDTSHGSAIGLGILAVVIIVIIGIFWYYFQTDIRSLIRWIRFVEMWGVSWFLPDDYTVEYAGKDYPFAKGLEKAPTYSKQDLAYEHLAYFSALAMQPLRWPFTIILLSLAIWALFRGPQTQFRTKLGLQGLMRRQAKNFEAIAPFVTFDPSTQPPRAPGSPVPAELPLFAEALGPEEWLAYHAIPIPDGKIDRGEALKAFALQLGAPWRGPARLAPEKQILLAAFCLKAQRKRADSDTMLGRLAACWDPKKGLRLSRDAKLLREARTVLSDADAVGPILAKVNQHAFETTALLRALATARSEGGVLAPAQFLWLRGHDRALWYPLNNLGRQSHHVEAMGAMAHFRVEKMTARPVPVPKLDEAVDSLAEYMASRDARPVPALDYSASKKRGVKKAK